MILILGSSKDYLMLNDFEVVLAKKTDGRFEIQTDTLTCVFLM
jgi:hypothetical protein